MSTRPNRVAPYLAPSFAVAFFVACITILLVFLKVIRAIDWSWIWVLAPLWTEFLFVVVGLLMARRSQERKGKT